MREDWKFMLELVAAIGAFAAWVALDHGTRQLIAAFLLGSILTIALFGWLLGFDVRSLSWFGRCHGSRERSVRDGPPMNSRGSRIEGQSGEAVWVQGVPAVWGTLPHDVIDRDRVLYVRATKLAEVLESQPRRLSDAQREQIHWRSTRSLVTQEPDLAHANGAPEAPFCGRHRQES